MSDPFPAPDDDTLATALAAALDAADPADLDELTICDGLPAKDVARQLHISERTVANITATFRARLVGRLIADPHTPRSLIAHAKKALRHL
jgi:FixJ family two-component response regulator